MNKITSGVAGAIALSLALAVAGCASLLGGGNRGMPACNMSVCNLVVTVSDCAISVDNPQLHVGGGTGNPNPRIHWILKSAQPGSTVSFAATNGIFFKPPTNGQFVNVGGSGPTYDATDLNTVGGTYHYGINVTQGGATCPTLDPIVINDM
jgi:hypothetical protein